VPVNVYLYAGNQIIENVTMGYFYYQDNRGNTTHVTDATGHLLERYTYSAFGSPSFFNPAGTQLASSAYGIRHLFQGQLWTQETGLNDHRNRQALPTMGVFLQPDPIGFAGGDANLYRYCGNNPVNGSDPYGLWTFQLGFQLSGQIGPASFAWGIGIAFDGHGNVGGYTSSYVGGSGLGADLMLGAGGMNSNADTIGGLEGPFGEASFTAGDEGSATVGTFISPDGKVSGSSIFGGAGAGLGGTGGISTTSVSKPWFNISDLFGSTPSPTSVPAPGGTTYVDPSGCTAPDCVTTERVTVTGAPVPGPTVIYQGQTYSGPNGPFHLGSTGNFIPGPAFTVLPLPPLTIFGGGPDWQGISPGWANFPGPQPGEGFHPVSPDLF
jgi:RHS repeat-associated protein